MIIDCHGHYTTAPKALQVYRDAQIAAVGNYVRGSWGNRADAVTIKDVRAQR
jgi:mono/diheme cytochrome c family protein